MSSLVATPSASALLLLAADKAEPMEFNWVPYATTLVVFGIVLFVLSRVVWPKITRALDEREAKILGDLRAADEAREQAKAALANYERSLLQAREEASRLIAQAKADAQSVANELRARNEQELTSLKQRAMHEIEAARASAVAELHGEAVGLAATMARRILGREIDGSDQKRLVEESLRELAAARRD